jgi:hypothetical protein
MIIVKNMLKSSQNIVLTIEITSSIANVITHLVEIKKEVFPKCVDLQFSFTNLCDFSDEDGMPSISLYPLTFFLHVNNFASIFVYSKYYIRNIPIDALPSPGVNSLEGSPKCSCGKRDSEGRSRLQAL